MFGTVRKHQTWLWAVIIAIIIVSFVVFFSPNVNLDMADNEVNYGTIKGKPITREEMSDAYNDVRLLYRLRFQQWPGNADDARLQPEIYNRLLMTKKMEEMNIHIPPEATARWIRDLFQRGGTAGASIAEQYQQFVKTQLEPQRLSSADFERFARNEVGQEHLRSIFGMSGGLIPQNEIEAQYKRENETMQTEVVFFSASNYLDKVQVTDDALTRYFNLNKPNYRIPDRIQLDYVKFDPTNYLKIAEEQFAKDTNANLTMERVYFQRGGTNAFKDEEGNPLTVDQAKPQLKQEYLRSLALMEARKQAAEFINALDSFQQQNQGASNALAQVAAAQNVKVQQTPLIDQSTDLNSINLPFQFRSAAFQLTPQEPFTTSPVLAEEGAFVLSLKKQVPGDIPQLPAVKDRVTQDFKQAEAVKLARAAGEEFQKKLSEALAEKKSFESILIGNKVNSVSLPAFSMSTQSMPELAGRLTLDRLQNAASRLTEGQSSELLANENGGAVVYLRNRKEVDQQKMNSEIKEFADRLREQREFMAYQNWLQQLTDEMELRRPVAEAPAQG